VVPTDEEGLIAADAARLAGLDATEVAEASPPARLSIRR